MDLIKRIAKGKKPPKADEPEDAEEAESEGGADDYEAIKDDAVSALLDAIKEDDKEGARAALEDFLSACEK